MLSDYHVNNRAWNFLVLIMFFALKVSREVKVCSLAGKRPADIFLQLKLLWSQNHKFSSGDSDRGFFCQILSTCLLNRISIANWRAAKGKTDEYLKPSFVWNILTMHSICFCRVPFTHLISRHFYPVYGVLDSVSFLQWIKNICHIPFMQLCRCIVGPGSACDVFFFSDYHVENHAWIFLVLIVLFALKLSRKVKACSLAENRPADIFLQLKLMSTQG